MHFRKYFPSLLLLVGLQVLLGSCKVADPVRLPPARSLPASFGGAADTVSSAQGAWRDFFTDPYLVALLDTALLYNPDLLMAMERVEMASSRVLAAKGELRPAVSAGAHAGVDKFGDYTMNGVGNYDTNFSPNINADQQIPNKLVPDYLLGLRSTWEVDLWGKLKARRKAAFSRYLASENGRQLVQTALVAQVARLYYQLVALDSEQEILTRNIALQQLALDVIKIKKAGGRETELAVQQAAAQLLNTRSLQLATTQQIKATENLVNQLLGRYPQPIARQKALDQQQLPTAVQAGVPAALLRRRPDIQQAEWELAAAKADVTAARAAFLPSLTLTPHLGLNAFKAALLLQAPASLAFGVLGSVSAPVFNRYRLKSDLRYSAAANREAYYGYQQAILQGFQEVVTGLSAIDNYRQVQELKSQEVAALQQAVNVSNDLFMGGYASYLEIITAQRGALAAELELVHNRRDMFLATVDLYRALGGGWQ
ncbi:MAG: efflux transporter outer membrane subunit [Adhaeribacter sp.]